MKQPKEKSPEQALAYLMDRCARAEICVFDARNLLYRWRIAPEEADRIMERLIAEKFIDEQRYAEAFVRDKMNFGRWGGNKIKEALYRKRIPAAIIATAMEQLDDDRLEEKLRTDMARKSASIWEEDPYKRKNKLVRFGLSRGYEMDRVIEIVEKITKEYL